MSGLLRLRDVTLALQFGIDKAEAEIADGPLPSRRYYFVGRCRAFLGGPVHVTEDARHAFDPDRKIVVVAYAKFGDGNRTADPAALPIGPGNADSFSDMRRSNACRRQRFAAVKFAVQKYTNDNSECGNSNQNSHAALAF